MKKSIETRKKKLLAFFLSVLMVSSSAAIFASCTEDTTSDSSSTSSESPEAEEPTEAVDDSLIKNGDFETFASSNGISPIGTNVTGWSDAKNSTTAGTAASSYTENGIIDTAASNWNNLIKTPMKDGTALTDEQIKTLATEATAKTEDELKAWETEWDKLNPAAKLAFYDAWEALEANDGLKAKDKFALYDSFTIDEDDLLPADFTNPGTHKGANAGEDTKILMIHNENPLSSGTSTSKVVGTAYKYTSSSTVTVPAGSSAQFSVWVKTADLTSGNTAGEVQDAVAKGAYISVTHSVGASALDAYQVKNINTEGVTENNGWVQYEFYLRSAAYTDTTFTVVLGLGQGGGTDHLEYVNGYAFFDDVQCEIIDNTAFSTAINGLEDDYKANFESTADNGKTIKANEKSGKKFALDFFGATANDASNALDGITVDKTETEKDGAYDWSDIDATNDVTKVYAGTNAIVSEATTSNNAYLKKVAEDYFQGGTYAPVQTKDTLLLLSANGTAYTATSTNTFTFPTDCDYLALSFLVKTSDMNGNSGAHVTLKDQNGEIVSQFTSIDTTTAAPVTVGDNEDYYDGWQKCYFFVEKATETETASFTLEFGFGPLTITSETAKDSFYEGFAAFSDFNIYYINSQAEFESASASTYTKVVSIEDKKDEEETTGNSGFDSVANVPSDAIETGFADLKNYKGVYADNAWVNPNGAYYSKNDKNNAGLLNKEYADEYTAILEKIGGAGATWDSVFGSDVSQPLVIMPYDTTVGGDKNMAYGFVGNSTTVAANSYAVVSLRVKTNGTANIYLIDTDDDSYQNTLSISRKASYWYDDEGNVCVKDPSASDYNKRTDVVLKIQSNGLYMVNPNCTHECVSNLVEGAYYANLSAYEKDDNNGNCIVADGGASHDYNSHWNNDGMDGIAFYNKNGKYYAGSNDNAVEVLDFAGIVPTRHAADKDKKKYEMSQTVTNTNGEWQIVTFYIHTGATAKNYRLEVWNGTRNDTQNALTTYAMFDMNNPGTAESNFPALVEEFKDNATTKLEDVFSYFDSGKFLRFDPSLDENMYGNLYEGKYVPSDYYDSTGIAYLRCENTINGEKELLTFIDYSIADVTITPDSIPTETEEEEVEEEEDTTNVWLLISSIAIAAVLVLAVASIVIRKAISASRRKRGAKARVESVSKPKKEKKVKVKKEETPSDDSPYND